MTNLRPASAPKLDAKLVAHSEARCLEQCLRSIFPIADKTFAIDSRSTDNTVAIARSFGAYVEASNWPGFGGQKVARPCRARARRKLGAEP